MQTNKKVEFLESDLKALTQLVNKFAGRFGENVSPPTKRRGGRTAVRHVFMHQKC
jgi:hypothetical protein